jgi:hypothetical protein
MQAQNLLLSVYRKLSQNLHPFLHVSSSVSLLTITSEPAEMSMCFTSSSKNEYYLNLHLELLLYIILVS